MFSQSVENFMKNIYDLQDVDTNPWGSTSTIVNRMGQKPASVTNMIQKMDKGDIQLVEYISCKGVRLNHLGKRLHSRSFAIIGSLSYIFHRNLDVILEPFLQ